MVAGSLWATRRTQVLRTMSSPPIIRFDRYRPKQQIAGRDSDPLRGGAFPPHTVRNRDKGSVMGESMVRRQLDVILAQPRGFCAGVVRAIEVVERALAHYGAPVYVRHEIVHNKHVVDRLREKGARFVEEVDDIPPGAITVFSAHGVARRVMEDAVHRRLQVIDATCPLVSKVHSETRRYAEEGYDVVLIGHPGHPEVVGTMGQISSEIHLISDPSDVAKLIPARPGKLAYVTQTTLSVDDTREIIDALMSRFPEIRGPDLKDICYATQNRQTSVRRLAQRSDVILVIGASYSSNSNRLREIGEQSGTSSYLIPDAASLNFDWITEAQTVGITAGASAPEELVQELLAKLSEQFDVSLTEMVGIQETVTFRLPSELPAKKNGNRKPCR